MKVLNMLSRVVNTATLAAMIAVGAFYMQDARAEAVLSTVTEEDRECLARNIYFEARSESIAGQVAVAWVTINRMEDASFPDTICGVIYQARRDANGNPIRHQCQFSWYCDGLSDRIRNQRAWEDAQLIADVVLLDWSRAKESPVADATYYHADYVSPYWARNFTQVAVVDSHIFYQP